MKTIIVTIEVYDDSKVEDVERAVSAGLDNNGIDCIYNVEEVTETEEPVTEEAAEQEIIGKLENNTAVKRNWNRKVQKYNVEEVLGGMQMRNIIYFDEKVSVEEYVKKEISKNGGTQSNALKSELISLCDTNGIEYDKKIKKEDLFDLLINNGVSYKYLAGLFGVGVSSQVYQKSFNITHKDVKRLERKGILKK